MAPPVRYAKNEDVELAYQVFGEGPLELALVSGFVCARRSASPPASAPSRGSSCYPERTRALVLYGTYPKILAAPDYEGRVPRQVLDGFLAFAEEHWGEPILADAFAPSLAEDERFRVWWARALRAAASPRTASNLIRMYHDVDVRHVLPALNLPTLVVHSTGDLIAPVAGGRTLAERIPGAKYVELPENEHVPMAGDMDAVTDEIEEFLTGRSARPARCAAAPASSASSCGPASIPASARSSVRTSAASPSTSAPAWARRPGPARYSWRTVADLVAGSGLQLEDRGVHELEGPGGVGLLAVP